VELAKYSIGVGDRFARQGRAQLQACVMAAERGVEIVPVWNKSNREHLIVGSEPSSVRAAADEAVRTLGWNGPFHVDADHINLSTVDRFLDASDFFTIDVAEYIGQPPPPGEVEDFVAQHTELIGQIEIDGIDEPLKTTAEGVHGIAAKYLTAVREAGRIYRHIESSKGAGTFVTEVSMDETDAPQTPPELLVILAALADEKVPVQTIAPKFTGRFNKGVDYVGDVRRFAAEFESDLAVIAHAVREHDLPENLKLSIHSGSDKFSLYGPMRRALSKVEAGVHLKTAGTTWLAELIGLAEGGDDGLALAQEVYAEAYAHREELCEPYAAVIDVDFERLPAPSEVEHWCGDLFGSTLRHDPANPKYDPNVRQLLHVGYKVAARMGDRYLDMLERCQGPIAAEVTTNLFHHHIKPLFLG